MEKKLVLEVKNLVKKFKNKNKEIIAVDNFSARVYEGDIMGIIGESGSGKSTVVNLICFLQKLDEGQIILLGKDITFLDKKERKFFYENCSLVFQDAKSSLNPRMTAKQILLEVINNLYKKNLSEQQKEEEINRVLKNVELPEHYKEKYPSELSGGECQRLAIARSLISNPKLLICDEITSALDVSIQAQIINLLVKLKNEYKMSIIFISHNLPLVSSFTDYVLIMKDGKIVEQGKTKDLVSNPKEEYTKLLLNSILEVIS